jgi:hypothetical protein
MVPESVPYLDYLNLNTTDILLAGLRIRINFLRIRIRIQHFRMTTNPYPAPFRIQGFHDQKLKKNYSRNLLFIFFGSIYLSLGLHKVCRSYRRSLQLSKEAIQHFKTWTFTTFFLILWVIFVLLDPDPNPDSESGSGSTDPIKSGSNPDPDPQPWLLVQTKN